MSSRSLIQLKENAERLREEGNSELAFQTMTEYLKQVHPSFTQASHLFLAEIHFENRRYEDALNECNISISLMNNFIPALELRSRIFETMSDLVKAELDREKIQNIRKIEQSKWDDPNHYYHYK
ncbi:hypothetical protein LPTSP3_g22750 [Leptospira kobayashii]|uniref:Tetratricopeptide repeat protein n=1 Tax=Leptospira kobayashii TaxID=1917830 RepID=A0ABM7UKD1_9LEPT|nr:hypothetical protein [Leptospira kobayashii]BDA79345.1 hypothetical protein LPTSP3_g22750 [Leptospira kobayashii]